MIFLLNNSKRMIQKDYLFRMLLFFTVLCFLPGIKSYGLSGDTVFFPEIKSWEKPSVFKTYKPGNLWDLINGAADLYLSYDFEELTVGNYTRKDGKYIVAEIYRHATVSDAFGIYSQERPLSGNYIRVGSQGYEAKGIINFFSGNYYVKISTHYQDDETLQSVRELSLEIANQLPLDSSVFEVIKLFPGEYLIENSEQFINSNFLGMSFLNHAFIASYSNNNGKKYNLFIISSEGKQGAQKTLNDYLRYAKMEPSDKEGRYIIRDRFNGSVGILWKKNYLFGFYNHEDEELRDYYMSWFEELIKD